MALLSQLIVRFGADIGDFTSDMGRAARLSKKTGADMERALKRGAAAAAAGLTYAAVEAGKFEKAMAEVSTLVDTSTTDMGDLTRSVLDMSRSMGTNARENASALYQIISAGASDSASAMGLLTAANKLAIGGVTDVKTAADGLTTVLNAYGMSAGEAGAVSDQMFATMRAGKTTIGELSTSYGQVATIAAKVGVGFDELSAATAALTKVGIGTSEAMNGIRGVLSAVLKQGDQSVQMADELGVAFSASAIRAKGFANWLAEVQAKSGGSEEKLAKLFGRVEGLTAVLALGANGGEEFNNILRDIENSAGATDEAYGKMGTTLDRSIERLGSAARVLAIQVGNKLIPTLADLASALADLLTPAKTVSDALRGAAAATDMLTEAQKDNAAVNQQIAAIKQAEAAIGQLEQQIRDLEEIQRKWYNQMADEGPAFQQRQRIIEELREEQRRLYLQIQETSSGMEEQAEAAMEAALALKEMDAAIAGELTENMAYLDRLIALDLDPNLQEVTVTAERLGGGAEDLERKIKALSGTTVTAATDMAESSTGMAAVMEQAWRNLDATFQDVWTNFFETGELNFGKVLDAFKSMMAQISHELISRPLVEQLGKAFGIGGGGFSWDSLLDIFGQQSGQGWDWGSFSTSSAANQLYVAAGNLISGWITDMAGQEFQGTHTSWSEAGQQIGGMVGTAVGAIIGSIFFGQTAAGAAIGNALGQIAGAIDGWKLEKLFGKKYLPQLLLAGTGADVAGKIGDYGNKRIPFDTAFGSFMVYNQNDLGKAGDELVRNMIDAIKDFDQVISEVMTPHQIQTVRDNLANWGTELTGNNVTIPNIIKHRFDQILEHFEYLTTGIGQYVDEFSDMESKVKAFVEYIASYNALAMSLKGFLETPIGGPVELQKRSWETLAETGIALREAMDAFEKTPEGMNRLTDAIANRYEAEIAFINEIDALLQHISSSIERQRASLRSQLGLDAERTPEQLIADARRLMNQLSGANSPEQIAALVGNIQSLIDNAVRMAPEELAKGAFGLTRDEVIAQALSILDYVEGAATNRANVLRENAIAEATALREEAAQFAEAQQISLDDIQLNTDATTQAVNDQTDILSGQNEELIDLFRRFLAATQDSKSSLGDVTIRGVT